MDIIFLFILGFVILAFGILTIKSMQIEDNRNLYNVVITLAVIGSLVNRAGCMLYSIFVDENHLVQDFTV